MFLPATALAVASREKPISGATNSPKRGGQYPDATVPFQARSPGAPSTLVISQRTCPCSARFSYRTTAAVPTVSASSTLVCASPPLFIRARLFTA